MANKNFPVSQFTEKEHRKAYVSYLFRRIFIDDWFLKIVALAITMTLWLMVSGLQTTDRVRLSRITLSVRVPDEYEITNSIPQEVEIQLVGEKRKLDQINPRNLVVSLVLSDISDGENIVRLTPENIAIDLEPGVKIERITPDRIGIKVERVVEFEVPIKPEIEGEVEKGYEVYGNTVSPEMVRVRGPRTFVQSLSFVTTDPISVSGKTADFSVSQIPLKSGNPKVSYASVVSANVTVKIGEKRVERLYLVPYETGTRKGKASVLLYGPSNILDGITAEDLSISETGTEAKSELKVELPSGTEELVEVKNVKFRE